ncbi:selU [Symbiodinium sp. CCMP2592]|nr:selU [Symbiodinium sp. CCMP2592]
MAARADSNKSSEKKVTISKKALNWVLPEDNEASDHTLAERRSAEIADQVASAVSGQILEVLQGTMREATASALQQVCTATARVCRLLDRLEHVVSPRDEQFSWEPLPQRTNTARPKSKKASVTIHTVHAIDGTFAAHPGVSLPVPMFPLPAKKRAVNQGTVDSKISWESVARSVRGDEPVAKTSGRRAMSALSLQGYAPQASEEDMLKRDLPAIHSVMNSQKSSMDDVSISGDPKWGGHSHHHGKLEKMGMKDLELKLAKELFLQRAPSNGCPLLGKEAGTSSDNMFLRRQGSKKLENKVDKPSDAAAVLPVVPAAMDSQVQEPNSQAPVLPPLQPRAHSNRSNKSDKDGMDPPGALPQKAIESRDMELTMQGSTKSRSRSSISDLDKKGFAPAFGPPLEEHCESSSSGSEDSQPLPRMDSNVFLRTENDAFKRNITAGRSKRDTCQLRDEKNEELIRATIKSVPGFTATDPTVAPILDVDISEEEERPKWTCLAKVGNGAVKVLSLINCSDSISESRITTALFHMVLMLASILVLSWDVGVIIADKMSADMSLRANLFYDAGFALGAFLCLICCGCLWMRTSVAECEAMLDAFADARELKEDWQSACRRDAFQVISFWLLATGERAREIVMHMPEDSLSSEILLTYLSSVVCFAVSTGILLACLFRILRLCRGFYIMIDDFSFQLVSSSDLGAAEQEWNLLQALLRRSCSSLQFLWIVLQSTIAVALILGLDDFHRSGAEVAISGVIVLLGLAQMFLHAASVTDHCERLPSFVNSLGFGRELDADRMYLVEYMFYSQAGFYVFEVRLTRDMVLKAFYICAVGVFYFVTKVMSGSGL